MRALQRWGIAWLRSRGFVRLSDVRVRVDHLQPGEIIGLVDTTLDRQFDWPCPTCGDVAARCSLEVVRHRDEQGRGFRVLVSLRNPLHA